MFVLHSHTPTCTAGIVIDIGSGSVGAAIVISDINQLKPEIIWTQREYVLIKDINATDVSLKEIKTSLIKIFLQLGSGGSKTLRKIHPKLSISSIDATISAPWTYTVTKVINFSDEHPFEVDEDMLDDLAVTAEKQTFTAVLENKMFEEQELEIIDNQTVGVRINGYQVINPKNIKAKDVSLSHITAITQKKIISVLQDSQNKVFPKTTLGTHSFMYMFYDVLTHMHPDTTEACLVDVTSEATEIGIIREGTLTYVTNTMYGTFSIAREIAELCSIPKEEAYAYIKGETTSLKTKLTTRKALDTILDTYENKITELFKKTGDALAIPKTIFLHCETLTEDFFVTHIGNAGKKATTMKHSIHPITSNLFEITNEKDTALLLSAHHMHKNHICAFAKNA